MAPTTRRAWSASASNQGFDAYQTETQNSLAFPRSAATLNGKAIERTTPFPNVTNGSLSSATSTVPRCSAGMAVGGGTSTKRTDDSATPLALSNARTHAVDNPTRVGTPIVFPAISFGPRKGESFATARIVVPASAGSRYRPPPATRTIGTPALMAFTPETRSPVPISSEPPPMAAATAPALYWLIGSTSKPALAKKPASFAKNGSAKRLENTPAIRTFVVCALAIRGSAAAATPAPRVQSADERERFCCITPFWWISPHDPTARSRVSQNGPIRRRLGRLRLPAKATCRCNGESQSPVTREIAVTTAAPLGAILTENESERLCREAFRHDYVHRRHRAHPNRDRARRSHGRKAVSARDGRSRR